MGMVEKKHEKGGEHMVGQERAIGENITKVSDTKVSRSPHENRAWSEGVGVGGIIGELNENVT
jgi:hypothetical protein